MEYIVGKKDFKLKNSAVTLGKFDGLHLGHQLLLNQVIDFKKQGYQAVMFTFMLHPGNLFSDKEFELIYTEEEKVARLRRSGIDVLISYPFTQETRSMEPEDFIEQVLVERLDAKVIVVGKDFRFGYKRRGDVTMLQEKASQYGYQVIAMEKTTWKKEIIGSTAIRQYLKAGDLESANAMLGHPFTIRGEVVHGRRIGRTIGMPTINQIPPSSKLLPPCGVYISRTLIDGILYPGVTNIGYKPTVGAEEYIGVETYIFDYDMDLYGRMLEVELLSYLRPELEFGTLEELQTKMREDIVTAKKYFKEQMVNIS